MAKGMVKLGSAAAMADEAAHFVGVIPLREQLLIYHLAVMHSRSFELTIACIIQILVTAMDRAALSNGSHPLRNNNHRQVIGQASQ